MASLQEQPLDQEVSVRGSSQEENTREQLYKVLVIGDFGVDINYQKIYRWDIAGHERFWHMTRVYYKYAIAAIIVFDLTRQVTFDSVLKWLSDVNEKVMLENGEPVPIILLANKNDADNIQVDTSKLDDFCAKHKIVGWFSTSAKENTNITEAMNYLVENIIEVVSHPVNKPDEEDFVDLDMDYPDGIHSSDSNEYNLKDQSYSQTNQLIGLARKPEFANDTQSNSCSC